MRENNRDKVNRRPIPRPRERKRRIKKKGESLEDRRMGNIRLLRLGMNIFRK